MTEENKIEESAVQPPPPQHMEVAQQQQPMTWAPTMSELERLFESQQVDPMLKLQAQLLTEALKNQGYNVDFKTLAALAAVYSKVADSRKKLIREVDKMRSFYFVDVILNQMTEDALAPEIGSGDILIVTSARDDIQKEIDFLEEKIDFDQLVLTITPDMLAYGEYTMEAVVRADKRATSQNDPLLNIEDKDPNDPNNQVQEDDCYEGDETGLVDILDSVDQASIIAITKWGDIKCYLVQNEKGQVERRHASEFIKFSLSSARLRIDLFKEFNLSAAKMNSNKCADIPRFVRVGRSIIYPIISKLKELEILEALVPATKISKLSSGSIVGVNVPAGYDVQKAMEAAKQVEQIINKKIGIDGNLGEITVENIMSAAGRIKVVPTFGDGKGNLNKMDYQSEEPEELLNSVVDVRKTICSSVGIPYELVFGSDEEKKGVVLRKYSRYLRKLKAIQKAVEEGIRQIMYIHLSNKGIDYTTDDIKVEFYNKLIEVDNLDRLEFMDTTIAFLNNIKEFVMGLADASTNPKFADRVHLDGFLEFLNSQLNTVGLPNIIDLDGDGDADNFEKPKEDDPGSKSPERQPRPASMVRRSPVPTPAAPIAVPGDSAVTT